MDTPNKEQVYDDQIFPLMGKILEICQQHGIAMIAQFNIPTPEDDGLAASSLLPDETGKNPLQHMQAARVLGMPI